MKLSLKRVSELVAQANDQFDGQNQAIDTVLGVIDSALRKQGIKADAVTIECVPLDKKIVFLLHDDKPAAVSIAFGNKAGDIASSVEYTLEELSVDLVVSLLVEHFEGHANV